MDLCSLLHEEQLHVSAPLIGHLQVQKWKKHSKQLYLTCVGCIQWGGQGCIQPTQVECSCLRMFLIYQPEIDQWKEPKHVVVLYVINYTYLYHHIVVLDRYTHCNLVYYKHNRDDELYDCIFIVTDTFERINYTPLFSFFQYPFLISCYRNFGLNNSLCIFFQFCSVQ